MVSKSNAVKKVEATAAEVVEAKVEVAAAPKYPTTEQMIKDGLTTKSARIRHLYSMGMPIGDIARQETGGLYQHAYNVVKKPLKRVEATAETPSTEAVEATNEAAEVTEATETAEAK